MKTEMQQYGYFQILVVNIVFFSFVWNLLLFLATYFGEPKFYTRSQFALWSSLYYGLRSLISLKRSRQDCRRLFCFIMSLLRQRLCLQEIRTSPFSQPLPHDSHSQKSLPHTTPVSSSSSSATLSTPAPTSQLGKRSVPINCNVGHNKKTLPPPPPVKTLQGLILNIQVLLRPNRCVSKDCPSCLLYTTWSWLNTSWAPNFGRTRLLNSDLSDQNFERQHEGKKNNGSQSLICVSRLLITIYQKTKKFVFLNTPIRIPAPHPRVRLSWGVRV